MLHLQLHWVYLKELSILVKITLKNVKLDVHYKCLAFQTTSEMNILRIRVRYPECMALLSIFKGTVDMN